ncbi:hypothetical protein JL722_12929 [Aureococcus anophagefferens]|nr:hypothetical protein JL722_12929 [Aureococcus anophagefferens]
MASRGRIRSLEIENFKSFGGKNVIAFRGFTSVVGPNGAGKSNLMDAVSFVLGIHSRHLRSSKLIELLHKGPGASRGSRRATVALTYERPSADPIVFSRTISPGRGAPRAYRLDGAEVTREAYEETLKGIGVLVKARNFLVFQGDVESLASKSSGELTALFEQISGSEDFKAEYDTLKAAKDAAEEASIVAFQSKKGLAAQRRAVKGQRDEADKYAGLDRELGRAKVDYFLWQIRHARDRMAEKGAAVAAAGEDLAAAEAAEADAARARTEARRPGRSKALAPPRRSTRPRGALRGDVAPQCAVDCIRYLRDARLGSALFLPLDGIDPPRADERLRSLGPGYHLAVDVVQCDAAVAKAVAYAVGATVVCDDLDGARRLCYGPDADGRPPVKAVTLKGAQIAKSGTITGGAYGSGAPGLSDRAPGKAWRASDAVALEAKATEAAAAARPRDARISRRSSRAPRRGGQARGDGQAQSSRAGLGGLDGEVADARAAYEAAQAELGDLRAERSAAGADRAAAGAIDAGEAAVDKLRSSLAEIVRKAKVEHVLLPTRDAENEAPGAAPYATGVAEADAVDASRLDGDDDGDAGRHEDRQRARWARCEALQRELDALAPNMKAGDQFDDALASFYADITKSLRHPNGGAAPLHVLDADEPYLGGVSFHATPPSKRFCEISQLSGGERTLASLALLFAVHGYHPAPFRAPFMIMDEVDAALDNVNVAKLANFIKHQAKGLQIIAVSLKDQFYTEAAPVAA